MALVKCKECGKEISKGAKICPQCGAKVKTSFLMKLFVFIICIIIIVSIFGGDKPNTTAKGQTVLNELEFNVLKTFVDDEINLLSQYDDVETMIIDDIKLIELPIKVSVDKMQKEYEQNEVKADADYKNKSLLVSTSVSAIRKDLLDKMVIDLRTSANTYLKPVAEVDKPYQDWVASLRNGDRIKMVCKGGGFMVGAVYLRDCKPYYNYLVNQDLVGKLLKEYNVQKNNIDNATVKLIDLVKTLSSKLNPETTSCSSQRFDSKKCLKETTLIMEQIKKTNK